MCVDMCVWVSVCLCLRAYTHMSEGRAQHIFKDRTDVFW
jgi:hypothetical protein